MLGEDGCYFRQEAKEERAFQEEGTKGAKILGPRVMFGVFETSETSVSLVWQEQRGLQNKARPPGTSGEHSVG